MKLKNKGVLLAGLFVVAAAFIAAGCGGDSGGGAPEAQVKVPHLTPDREFGKQFTVIREIEQVGR